MGPSNSNFSLASSSFSSMTISQYFNLILKLCISVLYYFLCNKKNSFISWEHAFPSPNQFCCSDTGDSRYYSG